MFEFEVGQVVVFQYPSHNFFGLPLEYRWRKVLITSIRFLDEEPLSPIAIEKRPLVRRGSVLIVGIDKDLNEERKFYLAAVKRGKPEGLRIVLIDSDEPDDTPEPIGRVFLPTAEDRRTMAETLTQLKERNDLPSNYYFAIQAVEICA